MFSTRALLVNLTIRQWTARKYDRAVSQEVDQTHNARGGGRYNKALIDPQALRPISAIANHLRTIHYNQTVPWGDNGLRLLPVTQLFAYRKQVNELHSKFDLAVDALLSEYPNYLADAAMRLGTMYNLKDYPTQDQVRRSFAVELSLQPVPESGDFRVDVAAEERAQLVAEFAATLKANENNAVAALRARVESVLMRYYEQCSSGVFSTALCNDIAALPTTINSLNFGDDPVLADIANKIGSPDFGSMRLNPELALQEAIRAQAFLSLLT